MQKSTYSADRMPVTSLDDLATIDGKEAAEGYSDGREGFPCGANRSRSYWHGWRNGLVDGGHAPIDQEQRLLVHEIMRAQYLKSLH